MFCVAICDDEEVMCTQLERFLEPYAEMGIVQTEVFYSGDKLYDALSRGKNYDLVFLDIEIQLMNGITVGWKIRNELNNERIQIIYISSKKEYTLELFAIRPMNFLVKPVSAQETIENVERAIKLAKIYDTYFEFKIGVENFRIPYSDIIYFESRNRKVIIHTIFYNKEVYGKLNAIEKKAPPNFIRLHQSYLVNRSYITYRKYDEICLQEKEFLPISQPYRKRINKVLLQNAEI